MVKKLFKHEFLAYARVMSIVYLVLLTVAAATRILFLFETDSIPYEIISTLTIITYAVSVLGTLAFAFVMAIVRFYRNLFTAEGYLSFTLPVTASQHIVVKAVTAVCVELVTLVIVLISACIVTAGDVLNMICTGLGESIAEFYQYLGGHLVLLGVEYLLLLVVALFISVMLYYTFISIGQLFRKNRILAAVGAYFAYYILTQILSGMLLVTIFLMGAGGALDDFGLWIDRMVQLHPYAFLHSFMWIVLLLEAAFLLIEFVVVQKIITKKLNLE